MKNHPSAKLVICSLVVLLIVLHQDNWFWNDGRLVFGFMPIGLFYHACISIAAAVTWYLAIKLAWPAELEFTAGDTESNSSAQDEGAAK